MHFSVWYNESGTKNANHSFNTYTAALDYVRKTFKVLSNAGKDTEDLEAFVMCYQHNHDESPVCYYECYGPNCEVHDTADTTWTVSDTELMGYVGQLTNDVYVYQSPSHLVFGGACNVGLLESGFMVREAHHSLDESLQELMSDIEAGDYPSGNFYPNDR